MQTLLQESLTPVQTVTTAGVPRRGPSVGSGSGSASPRGFLSSPPAACWANTRWCLWCLQLHLLCLGGILARQDQCSRRILQLPSSWSVGCVGLYQLPESLRLPNFNIQTPEYLKHLSVVQVQMAIHTLTTYNGLSMFSNTDGRKWPKPYWSSQSIVNFQLFWVYSHVVTGH